MKSRTDWDRVKNMKDEDIDYSDIPELGEEFFKTATLVTPKPINLGGTGTRHGMTVPQRIMFKQVIKKIHQTFYIGQYDHGDCLGFDAESQGMMPKGVKLHVRPPTNDEFRAYCKGDKIWPVKKYLERNRDIGDICHRLVAASATDQETQRGGTWYTIRYVMSLGKPVTIIFPDGRIEHRLAKAA